MFKHQCPHPYHKTKRRLLLEKWWPVAMVVIVLVSFFIGRVSVRSIAEYVDEIARVDSENSQLAKQNSELVKQMDFLEEAAKIDNLASKDARQDLANLHEQLSDAKEQIGFYRRVVSPETLVKGGYVHSFEVFKGEEAGDFRFQLVIAQGSSNKRVLKGKVTLFIEGKSKGETMRLPFKALVAKGEAETLSFSFRYFQIVSSDIKLPDDFSPERVVVILKPSSSKSKLVEKQWRWQDVMKSNEPA